MRKSHSSSDIFKSAHKLDKYLMHGDPASRKQSSSQQKKASHSSSSYQSDDIDDPLSTTGVGSDDEVNIFILF